MKVKISKKEVLRFHKENQGKIEIALKVKVRNKKDLSLAYTPGVAYVAEAIAKKKELSRILTNKGNSVAIVTDGSAVLGLGNVGPEAALPVMEGKAVLFKRFAGIDAFPLVLATQDPRKIIEVVKALAPSFSAINLEDISAPRCFEIERTLREELEIPVFHDDQHGAAVVILAALINALKAVKKEVKDVKIVINGAGAAGIATFHLLWAFGFRNIVVVDKQGILHPKAPQMNKYQKEVAEITNPQVRGGLKEALKGADVFIGVSVGNLVSPSMVKSMNKCPIVFALANPVPEIEPSLAKKAGAYIVATGRSDYPNQINNALVFPGLFKGLLEAGATKLTTEVLLCAASCLSRLVKRPNPQRIIPSAFDKRVVETVAYTLKSSGVCQCKY